MFNKLKGRFAEAKEKQERTVISYEDMPLDDYEQERTEISPAAFKKIIFGVLGVLLLALIVFAFANRERLTWDNLHVWWNYEVMGTTGKGYPVNIVGTEVEAGNIAVYQGRVAYSSDTSFVSLNSSAGEVSNKQLRFTNPVMKSADNHFLIYGLGEKSYQLEDFDRSVYDGTAEGGILAGDIAPNGRYCIAVEGKGFFSELYAFDAHNNRIYKYSFSEYYISSVSINMSGTGCVACGVSNNNGEIKACAYVLDFTREAPLAKYEIEGDYVIDCKFISGSRAVLVGGTNAYLVRVDDERVDVVDYEDKTLKNYCFSPATGTFSLALSKSGDGRRCDLIIYNDNGEKQVIAESSYGSESLSSYKGVIATLDNNTIYVFDSAHNQRYSCSAGAGAKRIILSSDREAFVLSVTQIRRIDLTQDRTDLSAQASPDSAKG